MLRTNNKSHNKRGKHALVSHRRHKSKQATPTAKLTETAKPKPTTTAPKPTDTATDKTPTPTTPKVKKTTTNKKTKESNEFNLDSLQLQTLPTPQAIIIGEQLQAEEEKQFRDAKSPLRNPLTHSFSFELPLLSRVHLPSQTNIDAINAELIKQGFPDLTIASPEESIPNWSKLTITEQLLLKSGYIALVPGSSNYTYLPMATRVLDKIINLINDEMISAGSQRLELPNMVEKKLLDDFQLYRQRMVSLNESIHSGRHIKQKKRALGEIDGDDGDDGDDDGNDADDEKAAVDLSQSVYESGSSPYYRFYNLQDEELVVSPPLLDFYTNLVKNQVKLANQLPLSFYQIGKKFRDVNDQNALLNASTNLSKSNETIGYMRLNQKDGHGNEIKSHQTETLMNGLTTATEYHSLNAVTFHSDSNNAHDMYKSTLDLFTRVFTKLGVRGVQVEADGSTLGAELSHEYHLIIGATSEAPSHSGVKGATGRGKKASSDRHAPIPSNTHALVQCGLCNYTASTENAQFNVSPVFDQASYNTRMKTGDLTTAMRHDPRSFGIFEPTGGDPQFDRDIRSKVTGLVKQMLPNLARRDVPMVANVVRLKYAPGQDGFYDVDANVDGFSSDQLQFINHAVIMLRADREFNPRAIARHFGCQNVEQMSSSESALMLLKFQKFKQKQYQDLIQSGVIQAFDPNFNIFSELLNKPLPVNARDVEKMYHDLNDVSLIEKEQRRLRRAAAKRDVNAGLVIVCDNTLAASGIDLDDNEMVSQKFLDEGNQDRAFGLKMANQGDKNSSKQLTEQLKGYKTPKDFQAAQHDVPPEFADQFSFIIKGLKENIFSVSQDGDIIVNEDLDANLANKFPEFLSMPEGQSLEDFKKAIIAKHTAEQDVVEAEIIEKDGQKVIKNTSVIKQKRTYTITRAELEAHREQFLADGVDIDDLNSDDLENFQLNSEDEISTDPGEEMEMLPILRPDDMDGKSPNEIFESAMDLTSKKRRDAYYKAQKMADEDPDQITMYKNEHGDLVDKDGQILPHITADLHADANTRRAFGKKGYDQIAEDDEFASKQGGMFEEELLSAINPAQGDFSAPQTGDKCIQSACHSQGMMEGLRSIEVGKLFYLSDSLTRNTDAIVLDNQPNAEGKITFKKQAMHMTSAKFGISRLMHALVESGQYDQYGLKWPELIAPYQVSVVCDASVPVNFQKQRRKTINKFGTVVYDDLDVYENFVNQAQLAEEEYFADLKSQKQRLKQLKSTPGVTPAMDKQRNLLIQDAEELLGSDDEENELSGARMTFGHWSWGLADNNSHSLNIASTLIRTLPTLEDDIIYDDRHHLTVNQRIQDNFSMGIPWIIVVDELMQEKGLVKVVSRAHKMMEYLSIDQVVHFFNGQRPLHQRPEHNQTEFERSMKYRVENALMGHFGKKAIHEGQSDFFKIQTTSEAFDYNLHVDVGTYHDEEYEEATTPRFDENHELVKRHQPNLENGGDDDGDGGEDTNNALKARQEAQSTGEVSSKTLKSTGADGKSSLLDDTIENTIKELNSSSSSKSKKGKGARQNQNQNPDGDDEDTPIGKAVDEWYITIKKLRRTLPPPSADELDRMFRVGILYKDAKGEVLVNELRAHANPHVVYGVDPHVVDQFERGNIMDLDRTGSGVKQIIDKHDYLRQQQIFGGQLIEKQITSGFFDLVLSPEGRQEQAKKQQDYYDWQTKQENKLAKASIFNQVKYDDPLLQYTQMNAQRREEMKTHGVTFRSLKDGSAVVHRPGFEPEQRPFDVRFDVLESPSQHPHLNKQQQQQPNARQQSPNTKQPQQAFVPPPVVQSRTSRPTPAKKSLSDIFSNAPVRPPRQGEAFPDLKEKFGKEAYNDIFGSGPK